MLDVFNTDAFSTVSLTAAINTLPYVSSRLAPLFAAKPITTTTAVIERQGKKLALIPARERGNQTTQNVRDPKRIARSLQVVHLPVNDQVLADEVQNVRAFGSEDATETVVDLVNSRMETMKQSLELTKEYHRTGAIQGVILDADGSTTLYNLFTLFGISETTHNFDFTLNAQDMKAQSQAIIRLMDTALGGIPRTGIRAICGDNFWDSFVSHASVAGAFERFQDNQFAREQQNRGGFDAFGIVWENYRGSVAGTPFIPTGECRFIPEGVPDLFHEVMAPANFIETVNTTGKPWYAKQAVQRFETGVDLHAQSNPLFICTRPEVLIKGY